MVNLMVTGETRNILYNIHPYPEVKIKAKLLDNFKIFQFSVDACIVLYSIPHLR